MKYCVCNVIDQTWGMYDEDRLLTIDHKEAKLYSTREEAQAVVNEEVSLLATAYPEGNPERDHILEKWAPWIEEVDNEEEFRRRPDTW